jgi:hypothetical protein
MAPELATSAAALEGRQNRMGFRGWLLPVSAFAATAVALLVLAGAGAAANGPDLSSTQKFNLSTRAGVVGYLRSKGINPHGVVIQRGARNYAGPMCPGRAWNCTTATRVVQIASTGSTTSSNNFSCTPSTGGSATAPTSCLIVQSSSGADNNATCNEVTDDSTNAESCRIFQSNTTGANNAYAKQGVALSSGIVQDATQNAEVSQVNSGGSNNVQVNQDLKESSSVVATGTANTTQTQDGHQTTSVYQHSDTGNNAAKVLQSLQLKATATGGGSITQKQDTAGSTPNTIAAVYQNTDEDVNAPTSTGTNTAYMFQSNDLNASASKATNLTQQQGTPQTGLQVHADQLSQGVSTATQNQNEHQTLGASQIKNAPLQIQYGPMWGGSPQHQSNNPGDTYSISQSSDQKTSPASTHQLDAEYLNCATSGTCTGTQKASNDKQSYTNTCSSTDCNLSLTVSSNPDVPPDICTEDCSDGGEAPPPPAPDYCSVFPGAPGCGPIITSVTFSGFAYDPGVTVTGQGFGAAPPPGTPADDTSCGTYVNNGSDYGDAFNFTDNYTDPTPGQWQAGYGTPPTGSCIGLAVESWSDTRIVFTFGSTPCDAQTQPHCAYDTFDRWYIANGDSFTLALKGASFSGTVSGLPVIG